MMIIDPNNSPLESNPTDAMSPDPNTEMIPPTGVPTPEFPDDWTNLDRIPEIITSDKPSILKRPVKPTATVLLIGETGTGKTTFMSLLVNLLQGKSLFELEDMHNESNESGLSKIQSQTTSAALYTVTTSDGFILNILDTPGLADTRGIDQDNKHKAEINRAIEEFVTSIDAVIIMANGTVQRLSAATAYTLNIITTIFPHSIVDNIGLMFTNSDSLSLNFQLESLPSELRQSPNWVIQNPLALVKNFRSEANRAVPQSVTRARERKLEASYWEAVNTLDEWLGWIDEREAKPTKEINDLYEKSIRIESRVGVALSHITSLAKKRNEWEQISAELNSTTAVGAFSKDGIEASILQQQEAVVWERKESENYNLICMEEGCHSNCDCPSLKRIHKAKQWSYNWMFVPGVGASALTVGEIGWAAACGVGMAATAGGAVVVGAALWLFSRPLGCEACHHSALQHRFYKLVHAKRPGQVDEETIRRFADAQTTEQKQQAAKEVIQEELDKIQSDMDETESVLRDLIDEFNQISLSGNFAGHVRSVIQILELRERELQSKTGADLELKLVRESIMKLKEKMNFLEEQTGATVNGNWKTVTKAKGFSKTVLLDSGYE